MLAIRLAIRLFRWALLFTVALALSAIGHLNTSIGRRAGRVITNVLVSDLIAGRLEVGRIDRLFPDRILLHDVSLYDPRDVRVIHGNDIVLVLDVMAALEDGTLRFSHAELHGGALRLEEGLDGLTFLEALGAQEPSTEPDTGEPFHAIVDDMRLDGITAYGAMLGARGLHGTDLRVHMRMEFEEYTDIRVFDGHGFIDDPMDFVAELDAISARVNTAPHVGSTLDARMHYEDQKARVHLRYAVPSNLPETAEPRMDLILEVDPIDLTTVYRIGFDWARPLQGRGSGTIRLSGPTDALEIDAAIEHDGGPIVLGGVLRSEGDIEIVASTTGIDVARLVPDTPSISLGGDVRLTIPDQDTDRQSTVHADVHGFVFEGYAIPSLTLDATLLDDRITIDSVEAPYGRGGELSGSGWATYEGDAHVEIAGSLGDIARDPNVQRHAPGARGRVSIRATVDRQNGELMAHVRGSARGLAMSDVTATSTDFEVTSITSGSRTRLRVGASAVDLRVASIMIGSGTASLRSQGDGYAFEGSFEDPRVNGQTSASGVLTTRGDAQILTTPRLRYVRRGVALELQANRIDFEPHSHFLADSAALTIDGRTAARMNARWTSRGADNAQMVIDELPLAALTRLFSPLVPELEGVVRGTASLSGDLETDPTIAMRGSIEGGSVRGLRNLEGAFDFALERGELGGHLQLDAGDAGEVAITLDGRSQITLPRLADAIREGEYNFHGTAESVDLAAVAAGLLGTPQGSFAGCLDGSLDVGGYLAFAPTLDSSFSIGGLTIGDAPPLELVVISKYDGQNLEATASVGMDPNTSAEPRTGRCRESAFARLGDSATFAAEGLAEIYGNVQVPLLELLAGENGFVEELQVVPWGASIRVPPRRLGSLPPRFRELVPEALHEFDVALSLSALGGFGMIQSSLSASLDYGGDTDRFICGRGSRPRISISATHANGDTHGRAELFVGTGRIASILAHTALPLEEWLGSGEIGALPPVSLDGAFTADMYEGRESPIRSEVEASGIPYLCEYFKGPFAGTLVADDLFTDHPTTSGALYSNQLQFRRIERSIRGTVRNAIDDTPVIPDIALKWNGDSDRLEFNHDMTWWGDQDVSQLTGFVDWTWNAATPVPSVAPDAEFEVRLDSPALSGVASDTRIPTQVPLQMVAGWIPVFGRVDGEIEAQLRAHGHLDDPRVEGRVHISEATLVIDSIGQRLRNVSGILDFDDEGAHIRHLIAHDEEGTATFDGTIALEGWSPTNYQLDAVATSFPIRDEGSIMARLTGRARLEGTMEDEFARAEMSVESLDIALEPPSSQTPISLTEHPDVRIVGLAAQVEEEELEAPYPIRLHIARTPRFWVRSDDFSAMVSTELNVIYAEPDVRISGDLELHRGYFEVFGKRFEVDQGSMVFDGGPTLDPLVSLVATHHLRGGGRQDVVVVHASGTLTSPQIEFTSPLVASGDQGQIICVLITGNASSSGQCGETSAVSSTTNQAGNQATQFLTGIAFGLATVALREQFGEYVPMIAIEAGAGGTSPRVRAGFNVDRLIPERLRRIVRGIYIEGYVSRQSSTPTPGQTSAASPTANAQYGFAVELQFPHNIVTAGEYAPQNSAWRLGVTWEP